MGKLEELEKGVKLELRKMNLNNELLDKAEHQITKDIRSQYLDSLESFVIRLHPQMLILDSEGNKKYTRYRNIILSIFAIVESNVDYLIRIKLLRNFQVFPRPKDGTAEAVSIILDELNFSNKIKLLVVLYNHEKINTKFLYNLNNIRSAFAHTLSIQNNKYMYQKKNVALDLNALDDLVNKTFVFTNKLYEITERQPEVQEFRKIIDEFLREAQ